MTRFRDLVAIAAVALPAAGCSQESTAPAGQALAPGMAYYTQYCVSCHGPNMDSPMGGGSLKDDEWKWGGTREDIFRSIHDGIPDMGMPAYGGALSDDQIELLVDAILGTESTMAVPPREKPQGRSRGEITTLDYVVEARVWVDGLDIPWGIDFIDGRTALITEKPGPVRLVVDGELHPDPIAGTPPVIGAGQGGMLDVAIDPDYGDNGWVYLAYSHLLPPQDNLAQTRVVRGRIADHAWTDEEVVFEAPEESYSTARHHYGTRIIFDREGFLYLCIGDRGNRMSAQDLANPNGKVHRIHRDGSIPDDNPYADVEGALASIWSIGHRNQQGMSFHPLTGDLYAVEHGPRGGDELNLVEPGLNYGWPHVTYGINYNGTIITRERVRPGLEQPVWFWRPSIAVCGMDFYTGDEFPYWRNHLLVSSLANQTLRLLHIENRRVIHEETILEGKGRIREAITGPDGAVYVVLNDPNEVVRLVSRGETRY